jgi:two-component system NarL family response regulator
MNTKILLVDDHRIVRQGVRALLEREEGLSVVGEASDGREAIRLASTTHPDVILMDVSMPELNGIDATKLILADTPKAKIIGLSMHTEPRFVLDMLAAGAAGYLVKSTMIDDVVRAIQATMNGQIYLSPEISGVVVGAVVRPVSTPAAPSTLSTREREVLQLLAEGYTSKHIADRLCVAVSTIESHRKQIMAKLGLHSVAALTKYAVREGLTTL